MDAKMGSLLLRCISPLQSWGCRSAFTERETEREPTQSGITGLLCASIGKDREDKEGEHWHAPLSKFAGLKMAVRVDGPGVVIKDYHVTGGGSWMGRPYGVAKADGSAPVPVISNRYYLSDAAFLVALWGELDFLARLDASLRQPVWGQFLGRKACVPSAPVWIDKGLREGIEPEDALKSCPWLLTGQDYSIPEKLRFVVECAPSAEGAKLVYDRPISFKRNGREFGPRYVREFFLPMKEAASCS